MSYGADQTSDLDDTTIVIQQLIGASRDLLSRVARVMTMNADGMSATALLGDAPLPGAADLAARIQVESLTLSNDQDPVTRSSILAAWKPVMDGIDERCKRLTESEAALVRSFVSDVIGVIEGPTSAS